MHDIGSVDLELAVTGEANLDAVQRRPDTPGWRDARLAAGDHRRAFAGAVALHDIHAQAFPQLLRGQWQRRAASRQQLQTTTDLAVDQEEQASPNGHRRAIGDGQQPFVDLRWEARLE